MNDADVRAGEEQAGGQAVHPVSPEDRVATGTAMTPHPITREVLPDLAKGQGHKFSHGAVLVLAGGLGRTGAARLAARAALRIGAGVVTIGAPAAALPEVAAQITALMLRQVDGAADLAALLDDPRLGALCLGPGLGLDRRAEDLLMLALSAKAAVVLDADALTLLARNPARMGALSPSSILTPHEGEFARLFPDLAARVVADDRLETRTKATVEAAARVGATVLLKGAQTVIAAPDGVCAVHHATRGRAVPWLATAGAGDVLAGIIAGLLARGLPPRQASCAATWVHVEAARLFGPGLIAEDLPDLLPQVLRDLEA